MVRGGDEEHVFGIPKAFRLEFVDWIILSHSLFVIASPWGRGNPVVGVVGAAHVSAILLRQLDDCPAGGANGDELVFAVGE